MSKNILFFSGGVESTAILESLKDSDVRLVHIIKPNSINFDLDASKKISSFYNKELETFEIYSNVKSGESIHQYNYMLMAFLYYSLKWPEIKNFYYGLHKDDTTVTTENGKIQLNFFIDKAKYLIKGRKIIIPFFTKTKKEQYDSLPESVKKMIHTCAVSADFCGFCKKCIEFKQYVINA